MRFFFGANQYSFIIRFRFFWNSSGILSRFFIFISGFKFIRDLRDLSRILLGFLLDSLKNLSRFFEESFKILSRFFQFGFCYDSVLFRKDIVKRGSFLLKDLSIC